MPHVVLSFSRRLEEPRGEHAASKRVLVQGGAEHRLVYVLELAQA